MKQNKQQDILKLFGMSNQMLELDLDKVGKKFAVGLRREKLKAETDNVYYPQFDLEVRKEAKKMAYNYEVFYCIEKSIRELISSLVESQEGTDWWDKSGVVPDSIKAEVKKRIKKEVDSAVTRRSDSPIDFTTFGELGEIIHTNWSTFETVFKSPKAVASVITRLNTLRGPIAHCTELAEDEELRLQLSVRDWFRLME